MITVDAGMLTVEVDGVDVGLTLSEYRIVYVLASNPGVALSNKALKPLAGISGEPKWHINHARKKGVPITWRSPAGYILSSKVKVTRPDGIVAALSPPSIPGELVPLISALRKGMERVETILRGMVKTE